MANITGNSSDNNLLGTTLADLILGKDGNDILRGVGGNDTLLGGRNDDQIFGGTGSDVLSGDDDSALNDASDKGNDILIGGSGADRLIGWGDDILVGGGANNYNAQLITDLGNNPFGIAGLGDGVRDTFVAVNRNGIDYTLTVVGFEQGIDRIDLRSFGVRSASDFMEIQDKGNFFEAKTAEVNGAELVLRINVDPSQLSYIL